MTLPSSSVLFNVPTVGDVEIELWSTRFADWFSGLTVTDGAGVFRSMLRDHGHRAGENTPLDPEVVAGLGMTAVYEGTSAFLAAAEPHLRPRWIRDPAPSNPGGVRERTAAEVADITAGPDEDELQRLAQVLALAAEDARLGRRNRTAKAAAEVSKAARIGLTPSILAQARSLSGLTSLGQLNNMIADLPSNRLKGLISQTSDIGALVQRPGLLTGIRSDVIPAYLRSGALGALQQKESILRSAGLLAASQKGMLGLAQGGVYNQLLGGALRDLSASGALASIPRPADWLKDINAVLGLGLTAQILAAAVSIQASPLNHPPELSAFMRPGWQATAAIGMAHDDARPAARAVLATYDEAEDLENELLVAAVSIAHQIDASEWSQETTPEELVAVVETIWDQFLALREGLTEELRNAGLVAVVACALGLAGVVGTGMAVQIAMSGPTAAQLETVMKDSDAVLREEQQKTRDALQNDARSLRRVTEPCTARTAPDRDAPAITTVYPDELIRVTDERGDWVKVEVYQYGQDAVITGWTPRKYIVHREG